jgi:hypothetical protein
MFALNELAVTAGVSKLPFCTRFALSQLQVGHNFATNMSRSFAGFEPRVATGEFTGGNCRSSVNAACNMDAARPSTAIAKPTSCGAPGAPIPSRRCASNAEHRWRSRNWPRAFSVPH